MTVLTLFLGFVGTYYSASLLHAIRRDSTKLPVASHHANCNLFQVPESRFRQYKSLLEICGITHAMTTVVLLELCSPICEPVVFYFIYVCFILVTCNL